MLKIVSFTFNPFAENTYLLINAQKEALVIDPGMSNEKECNEFYDYLSHYQIIPKKILNTHAHIDHIFGVSDLKKKYQIPFGIHKSETPILENAIISAQMFGLEFYDTPQPDFHIKESTEIIFGDFVLQTILTPGHSPGSLSYYLPNEKSIISGDVLFQKSIGRTDLPGGNYDQLIQSIKEKLFALPEETKVYPGHGPVTDISTEKEFGYLAKNHYR